MTRSGACMAIGSLLLAGSFSAQAVKEQTFDPRDPAIWQEKPVNPSAQSNSPCEVFSSSVCPGWEDENRISSVTVSGGNSSVYRTNMNAAGEESKTGNAIIHTCKDCEFCPSICALYSV